MIEPPSRPTMTVEARRKVEGILDRHSLTRHRFAKHARMHHGKIGRFLDETVYRPSSEFFANLAALPEQLITNEERALFKSLATYDERHGL